VGMINLVIVAAKLGIKPKILTRINPEVRTFYRNGKFGILFNGGTIKNISKIKHIVFNEFLGFEGFRFHLGSQITDFSCLLNTFSKLDSFISKLKKIFLLLLLIRLI
jgi:diaminopimelate decarboxylase